MQPGPVVRDAEWRRAARWARWLSWISLAWMLTEAVIGLWQGPIVGSIALTGWALGSAVEGMASVIVIWRFSGSRTLSETAEWRAQRGVAVSFWLLALYIAAESIHHLLSEQHAETTLIGIVLTTVALLTMPILGRAKHTRAPRGLARRPPPAREPKTTSAPHRPPPSWPVSPSQPAGPAAGGSTP